MKFSRKNKGITLVALVVTIIVLLILAGVSLRLVAGGSGIFEKTEKAVSATEIAQINESKTLSDAEVQMQMYESENVQQSLYDFIVDQCKKNGKFETSNGTYWLDEDGVLHYTDNATGADIKLVKGKDGNPIIKEITTKDGTKKDMSTAESLKNEIESAIQDLVKEYHEKYGTENQEKTFAQFIEEKCNETGKDYVETGNNGKLYPDGNGNLIYQDINGNNTNIVVDNQGKVAIKEIITADGNEKNMTTAESLKTELNEALEALRKEWQASGSTDTFEEWLRKKCEENGGIIQTSTGGTIKPNDKGGFTYEDGSKANNKVDFMIDENGNANIESIEINRKTEEENPSLPSINLTPSDINLTYSESDWTNKDVTVTATPNIDITGYTLQTSKNGVAWSNSSAQTFSTNGRIYVRLYNGVKYGGAATGNVTKIDKLSPSGTLATSSKTNSATLTVTASDEEATAQYGKSDIKGYYYSKDDGATYTELKTEPTYTFTGLTQNTEYSYKVKIEDNAGNVSEISAKGSTGSVAVATKDNVTYSTVWNGAEATVTFSTTSGFTIETSTNNKDWTTTNPITVNSGTQLYVRLTDTTNSSASYAAFKPVLTYNIAYTLNQGTKGSLSPTTANYGDVVAISNPTRTGYDFAGWTVSSGLSTSTAYYGANSSTVNTAWTNANTKVTNEYFKNLSIEDKATVTLCANWTLKTYQISYNANTGSGTMSNQTKKYGEAISLSNNSFTAPSGYHFKGWNTSANGSGTSYSAGSSYSTEAGLTLYAIWEAHSYTAKTMNNTYLVSNASCTAPATYYYACAGCGAKGTNTYTNGSALGHDYSSKTVNNTYLASNATCTAAATYYYKCSRCTAKGTSTYTNGSALGHDYSSKTANSTYLASNATCTAAATYYYKCSRCTAKGTSTYANGSALGHDLTVKDTSSTYLKSAATCQSAAVYYYKCSRCGGKGTSTYTYGSATSHSANVPQTTCNCVGGSLSCTNCGPWTISCRYCGMYMGTGGPTCGSSCGS